MTWPLFMKEKLRDNLGSGRFFQDPFGILDTLSGVIPYLDFSSLGQ